MERFDCTVNAMTSQLAAMQQVAGSIHGANLYLIHKLLLQVWVSYVCDQDTGKKPSFEQCILKRKNEGKMYNTPNKCNKN